MITQPLVEVAAAVILKPDGNFLLTQRPEGKPYSGYWEFPGGKIEKNETPLYALNRELQEELGIQVIHAHPWMTRIFAYEHATVKLHFYRVTAWQGDVYGREQQQLSWQTPLTTTATPMLPANGPVLSALKLPPIYGITRAAQLGVETTLQQTEVALQQGLRLIQIREKAMGQRDLHHFIGQIAPLAQQAGARIVINGEHLGSLNETPVDGVHLTAAQLMAATARPQTNSTLCGGLCSASCHNIEELYQAEALELDFVVLGPVHTTPSHADTPPLGWKKFAALIRDYSLPVYALGGMTHEDLTTAQEMGAHGIAVMRHIIASQ